VADWEETLREVEQVAGVTDEERKAATLALSARKQQLADYLAAEAAAIADYQHELWRLQNLRESPAADGAPFVEQQIAAKESETGRTPLMWVAQVRQFEGEYHDDLREILTAGEAADTATREAIDHATAGPERRNLELMNAGVAFLTAAVGLCLLVGLLTRLAAAAGALFLVAVIATQPPWMTSATPTYYQTIELAGLVVLAATGAGRWAGLDFFGYAFCQRFCGRGDMVTK
jgi:uncharacterized membrane protein YphA (DoxX/SURF4 family)